MELSRQQMQELLEQNDFSFSKVARRLKSSPQAVKQMAKRMGLELVKQIRIVEPTAKVKTYDQPK